MPNAFTAPADVLLGAAVARAADSVAPGPVYGLLALASVCLYCGGLAWNDYFDLDQDRRERPARPLPSGRITSRAAAWTGALLLTAGVTLAWTAGLGNHGRGWFAGVVALALAACILLYDATLKRTCAGPLAMGACRSLNVLLGCSIAGFSTLQAGVYVAAVVGIYIAGVTWFAQTEARRTPRYALVSGAAIMLAAVVFALATPAVLGRALRLTPSPVFPYLLVVLGWLVGAPVWRAIKQPTPPNIQVAVKRGVLALVVLDAALATAIVGLVGLGILLLLAPALYLGRWLYST